MLEQSQAVTVFNFQGSQEVRTTIQEGEIYCVGIDVCQGLGIANHRDAIASLPEKWKSVVGISDPHGRIQPTLCVKEPGVYKLAFRSNKPEAEAFTEWVAEEVLPSIRKTGQYGHPTLVSVRGDHFLNVNQIDDIKTIDVTIGKLQQQKRTLLAIAQRKLGVIAHGARVPLTPEEQDQLLIFHASTMKESCARNIGRRIKRSIPEVRFHLEELVERGLLWREPSPSGRTVYYRPIQQKQLA